MRIVFLADNRSCSDDLNTEHGLSVYVETGRHKILLDTGASDLFLRNAEKQGIDIADVDYAFISHGHYDHIGGLPYFVKANSRAKIIMSANIIGGSYVSKRNHVHSISSDIDFDAIADRLILVRDNMVIDEEIRVIADIPYVEEMPNGNCNLFSNDSNGNLVRDDFCHETALVIGSLLFSGCAHHGIINIMKAAGSCPACVIGGFHLLDEYEGDDNLRRIAATLRKDYPDTMFYTGHCTGDGCIEKLKGFMEGHLDNFCLGCHIPDISVKVLRDADSDTCSTVRTLVRQLSLTSALPTDDEIRGITRSSSSELFAMYYDGTMIGMAVLCRCLMPTGTKYWIEDVTIDTSYRGRHLGKLLVRHMLSTLPSGSKVLLTSRPSRTAANNMYQKLGFTKRETNVYIKEV